MSLVEQVIFYATLSREVDFFTLNDPVRGQLNGSFGLTADSAFDISSSGFSVTVRRGRGSRLNEDIPPGQAVITLRNHTREWDPNNSASEWFGNIVPGKRVRLDTNYTPYFDGFVEDWNFTEDVSYNRATATILAIDALGSTARMALEAFTPTAQTAGARINAVLERSEVNYGSAKAVDAGVATMSAEPVSADTNVLGYLQTVAKSDFGYLYASRNGTLTYQDRSSFANPTVITLAAGDPTFKFHGLELQYGSETLYNRVTVTRSGGTMQVATDETSRTKYKTRTLSLSGLLLDSDTAALSLARYLVNIYREPKLRVSAVTVALHDLSDYACQTLLSLDIGSPLQVQTNFTGTPADVAGIIEGIEHNVDLAQHFVTFRLSDLDADTRFLVLNDSTLGVLNTSKLSF